ncbi:MAG: type IV secretion IcmS family protein [Gammaproteobacteria bacterium]|jgi:intracellular multiplication protein IcmS
MNVDLKKTLISVVKSLKVNFTLYDKPISYEEAFSETGLLPALARRADQLSSLCLGYGIGASFSEVEKSLMGAKVQFDEVTPMVLRLLCLVDIVSELIKAAPSKDKVPLDELLYD